MTSPSVPLTDRLWARVEKTETCWLWTGALAATIPDGSDGYGHLAYRGQHLNAHRLSWELHNGPVPTGMEVMHRCDVRRCVRPDHLFLGTHADNMADGARKGRVNQGERNALAKLDAAAVRSIRSSYSGSRGQIAALARRFGVNESAIRQVVRGQTWAHVTEVAA